MAGGHVNRAVLQSYYQNPGETYDDAMTEGAYEVLAQQIDDNWDEHDNHKNAAVLDHPNGSVTTAKIRDGAVTAAKLSPSILVGTPAALVQANLDAHKADTAPHATLQGVDKLGMNVGQVQIIENGSITVTKSYHTIDTEGGASIDELTTINGGNVGDFLILRQFDSLRDIIIRGDGAGNIYTFDRTNITLDSITSAVMLFRFSSTQWIVLGIQGVKRSGDAMMGNFTALNIKRGTGSPEGAVTGNVGDIYQRTNGGASTTLYVKESGTGNTGWKAVQTV